MSERAWIRGAQRGSVADLESRIQSLESDVEQLTTELEDPELYTKPGGRSRANELGSALERVRPQLDAALEEWTRATDALDALASQTR